MWPCVHHMRFGGRPACAVVPWLIVPRRKEHLVLMPKKAGSAVSNRSSLSIRTADLNEYQYGRNLSRLRINRSSADLVPEVGIPPQTGQLDHSSPRHGKREGSIAPRQR